MSYSCRASPARTSLYEAPAVARRCGGAPPAHGLGYRLELVADVLGVAWEVTPSVTEETKSVGCARACGKDRARRQGRRACGRCVESPAMSEQAHRLRIAPMMDR